MRRRFVPVPDVAFPAAVRPVAAPAQTRLDWTLHRGPHVLAVPGTTNPSHLTENITAGTLRLTAEELTLLDGPADTQDAKDVDA